MKASIILCIVIIGVMSTEARPQHFVYGYHPLPAPQAQTTVLRDALGNQATAYAYNDGHSSSVAVSRNDVSKHLTYVPAPAPVIYEQPYAAVPYAAPAAAYYGNYYL